MATEILLQNQTKVKYAAITNVAQVNDALTAYASDQTIVNGLNEMKNTMLAAINNPCDCPQCGATGKVDAGASICPLCNGMTKTSGQYTILNQQIGFTSPQ